MQNISIISYGILSTGNLQFVWVGDGITHVDEYQAIDVMYHLWHRNIIYDFCTAANDVFLLLPNCEGVMVKEPVRYVDYLNSLLVRDAEGICLGLHEANHVTTKKN